jgi:hypothetical protein
MNSRGIGFDRSNSTALVLLATVLLYLEEQQLRIIKVMESSNYSGGGW